MSLANDPADKPTPVIKDKNPHNYRKVGYSMIVISVSLVVIGLLSWNLSDNYHFSSNIMALQEVDTMTPKTGYNIVLFDVSQPVGAKLKLLDHADTLAAAQQLQSQDTAQNTGSTTQVLIFNGTKDYNLKVMAGAEVFLQTPETGYNVVLDNYNLAVGQKLTRGAHEESLANATSYETQQQDQIQGQEVKILIFTPSFTDNLKMVTNSSTPVANYTAVPSNQASAATAPQTSGNQTTQVTSSSGSNATAVGPSQASSNQTVTVSANKTSVIATNQTVTMSTNPSAASVTANNSTVTLSNPVISAVTANQTASASSNQTNISSSKTDMNTTSAKVVMNATATVRVSKSVSLNETVGLNATGK